LLSFDADAENTKNREPSGTRLFQRLSVA
jgi:hypothetical protein